MMSILLSLCLQWEYYVFIVWSLYFMQTEDRSSLNKTVFPTIKVDNDQSVLGSCHESSYTTAKYFWTWNIFCWLFVLVGDGVFVLCLHFCIKVHAYFMRESKFTKPNHKKIGRSVKASCNQWSFNVQEECFTNNDS